MILLPLAIRFRISLMFIVPRVTSEIALPPAPIAKRPMIIIRITKAMTTFLALFGTSASRDHPADPRPKGAPKAPEESHRATLWAHVK